MATRGPMMNSRTNLRSSAGAIVASVVVCLFLLQGFCVAAAPSFARGSHSGAAGESAIAIAGEHCSAGAGDGAPAQGHHDHSQCCISCSTSGRDASVLLVAALLSVAIYSAPEAFGSRVRRLARELDTRALWRTGGWSSRAPPL